MPEMTIDARFNLRQFAFHVVEITQTDCNSSSSDTRRFAYEPVQIDLVVPIIALGYTEVE